MADGVREGTFADPDRTMLWLRSASGHIPSHSGGRRGALGCRATTLWGVDGVEALRSLLQMT